LCPTRWSRSPPKPCRRHVLPAISTWPSTSARTTSTWDAESTLGTSLESIRCYPAPELIGCKQEWEAPSESHTARLHESKSDPSCTQWGSEKETSREPSRLSEELKTNSQELRDSSFPTSGASPNSPVSITSSVQLKAPSSMTDPTSRS
jgi:hypothetical protein